MVATPPLKKRPELVVSWEKPPADFQLDDTPVENTGQPLIAGALRESLEISGRIQSENLIASNFGLCAKVGDDLTIKAPDWLYSGSRSDKVHLKSDGIGFQDSSCAALD